MDERNQYVNTDIKWIVAQRRKEGKWEVRFLSTRDKPTLDRVLDETPVGEIAASEFGVFRNREDWWEYRPRNYYCGFSRKVDTRQLFGGLICSLPSDYF